MSGGRSPRAESNRALIRAMVGEGDSTVHERCFFEPCQFQRHAPRQCSGLTRRGGHPVLGLAPARHRLRLGRGRGAGVAAIFAVRAHRLAVDGRGLADRRRTGPRVRTAADRLDARRLRRRLVDGLRLFSRRPVVGRRGVPRRGRQVRLGAAAWRRRPAGGPRSLSRRRLCDRARLMVAGTRSHFRPRVRARAHGVGARPPVHRVSLERPRHGAGKQSHAGSDRFARRPARAHVPDHRHIRHARDALAGRRGPAQPCSGGPRHARACPHRRLRRLPARGAGQRHRFRASSCASSSPTSPRTSRSRRKTGTRSCAATSTCRSARPPRTDPGFATSPT